MLKGWNTSSNKLDGIVHTLYITLPATQMNNYGTCTSGTEKYSFLMSVILLV